MLRLKKPNASAANVLKRLILTKALCERKTAIKPGSNTWQNTTKFEVFKLLTSAIASEDKRAFTTWKTKHTQATVSQDGVRHLVTCSSKPWFFPPTERTFNIYKRENWTSKTKSTRNLIRFHCSSSSVPERVHPALLKYMETKPPRCSWGRQNKTHVDYTLPSAQME